VLGVIVAACIPALAVERPWSTTIFWVAGRKRLTATFRNDGVDVGQRDKEIADYCRKLGSGGEVPWVGYMPSFMKPDLIDYRHVRLRALNDLRERNYLLLRSRERSS